MIAESLGILNDPITYKLGNLSAGEYWLGVKAINEGMFTPASAHISLTDGKSDKEFSMDAWKDSAASWKIIVKKKVPVKKIVGACKKLKLHHENNIFLFSDVHS